MAIKPEDIIKQYEKDMRILMKIIEPKLDKYLLEHYSSFVTSKCLLILYSEIARMRNNSDFLPEYLRLGLVNMLSQIYIDWTIQEGPRSSSCFSFSLPKNLSQELKDNKNIKKYNEEVNDRAEIIDI